MGIPNSQYSSMITLYIYGHDVFSDMFLTLGQIDYLVLSIKIS